MAATRNIPVRDRESRNAEAATNPSSTRIPSSRLRIACAPARASTASGMPHWYFHGLSSPGMVVASSSRPAPNSRPICHSLSTGRTHRTTPAVSTVPASRAEFWIASDQDTS